MSHARGADGRFRVAIDQNAVREISQRPGRQPFRRPLRELAGQLLEIVRPEVACDVAQVEDRGRDDAGRQRKSPSGSDGATGSRSTGFAPRTS